MDTLAALSPSAARSCGIAPKSRRNGCGLRDAPARRVEKDQNPMGRWLERRMDRRFFAYDGRRMAEGAGFREVMK